MTKLGGEVNELPSVIRVSSSQVLRVARQRLGNNGEHLCIQVLDGERELFSDCGPALNTDRIILWLEKHYAGWTAAS
jgi:hypothetical protein